MNIGKISYMRVVSVVLFTLTICFHHFAHAQTWQVVTESGYTVSQSTPLFDRRTRTYLSTVTISNNSDSAGLGQWRLVIANSNKAVSSPNGTTADNKPYFTFIDANAIFESGASYSVDLVFSGGRGQLSYSAVLENLPAPVLSVSNTSVNFGDVTILADKRLTLDVSNTGQAPLDISSIETGSEHFVVYPPTNFQIPVGGIARKLQLGFRPQFAGEQTAALRISSNAGEVSVSLSGRGTEPLPSDVGQLSSDTILDFGQVQENQVVTKSLKLTNTGNGTLTITELKVADAQFDVRLPLGGTLPLVLPKGQFSNIELTLTPNSDSAGQPLNSSLSITSNDPEQGDDYAVAMTASVLPSVQALTTSPVLGARILAPMVNNENCQALSGEVLLAKQVLTETIVVSVTDQGGQKVVLPPFTDLSNKDRYSFENVNLCGLDDGLLSLTAVYGSTPEYTGTPVAKNTSELSAPVLDAVEPVTIFSHVDVCGQSKSNTTVTITGGSSPVSIELDQDTSQFCLAVPLKENTDNTLIASAVDNLAPAPKPKAIAQAFVVTQVNPSDIVIAEASSRPLTTQEVEQLVDNGVINLDDSANFNVSVFTIVLTVGEFPITYTDIVTPPRTPGRTSYGYSGRTTFSQSSSGGSGSGSGSAVCTSNCSQVVVISTPSGESIPGVIILDGRIKTLKEFFQVTLAIQNASSAFDLIDMSADIQLPAGLSPVKAGLGTDVSAINTESAIDTIDLGSINPGGTGIGQFIIRGDAIGQHNVEVLFDGFLANGGIAEPIPVNGSASTSVQVFGPPEFDVVVRHPSRVGEPDVYLNEIYNLVVDITNTSSRPANYASLQLFIGGNNQLVDENDVPIPSSNEIKNYGHILPGQTVSSAFRVKSLVQGEIIACQAIASENLSLSVDTGPDGTSCNIANSYPANFQPLPADLPPQVIGINPLNGQPGIPVTTSVFATLTPQASCLSADTFTNIVLAPIDPADLSKGNQVVSATLASSGTFFIEELDAFGNAVRRIPTDLTVEDPPAGGTTIAVLRLGLPAPHLSQFFLSDNPATQYRVTLVGGENGVCSSASGAKMTNTFTWTFSTAQACNALNLPSVNLAQPNNGANNRPVDQSVVLNFSNSMSPQSLSFVPFDLAQSSFSIYQGATELSGELDLTAATPVAGSASFDSLNRLLTFKPSTNLTPGSNVYVRLTDKILDACGNPLVTPANGVKLFNFATEPLDTTSPAAPRVNQIVNRTNQRLIQVSGEAEPNAKIRVSGGEVPANTTASESGLFSALVPLILDQQSNLSVIATDASGNGSVPSNTDTNGLPLVVVNDSIRPAIASITPVDNATNVSRDVVINVTLSEAFKPESLNSTSFILQGSVIAGELKATGATTFSFTPQQPLDYNKTYTIRMVANGLEDLAGNKLGSTYTSQFSTENFPLPELTSLNVTSGKQGESLQVTFVGKQLTTTSAVISDNTGITGSVSTTSDTEVTATVNISALAATGVTTLGLQTLGGVVSLPFTVTDKPPVITSITPNSVTQGQTVVAKINGFGLANVNQVISSTAGVNINILSSGSDGFIDVEIVAAANAAIGTSTITVVTPGGATSKNITIAELILAPVVNSLSPNSGIQGSNVTVTFTGTNLANATALVSTNPAVTGSIVTSSPSSATANISIANNATPGVMQLGLTTPGGSDTAVFTVNEPVFPPVINSISPQTGVQGTTVNTSILGQNLLPVTGLSSDCTGLSLTNLATGDNTRVDLEIAIGLDAEVKTCQITVATAGGNAQVNFTVNEAPKTLTFEPLQAQMQTSSSLNIDLKLNVPAPAGGITVALVADNANITVPATVTILEGELSAPITLSSAKQTGVVNVVASASGLETADIDVEVLPRTFNLFSPLVGIDRMVNATLTLDEPAPVGGTSFDLSIADNNVASLSTNSVTIAQGQTQVSFGITGGLITGITSVTANGSSDGYQTKSIDISVTDRLIDLPAAQQLTLGSTQSLNLLIAPDAAPAGGIQINVSSSDTSLVEVLTPTVTIAEGSFQAEVIIRASGAGTGMAIITASNSGFAPDTTQINLSAGLNIIEQSLTIEPPATQTIHFELTSAGQAFAAPAGGALITLNSSNSNCVSVPSSVTVAEGAFFASATLNYANVDSVPCTSVISATNDLFGTDTIAVTVDSVPDIGSMTINDNWFGDHRLGSGQQIRYSVNLTNGTHGGVTVNVSSDNPSVAILSDSDTSPGSASVSLTIPNGQTSATFYVQGVSGATGDVTLSATTPLFTSTSRVATVVQPILQVRGLGSSTTSLSANDAFNVRAGYLHSNGSSFRYANISAAAGPLTVNLNSSDDSVGVLNKTSGDNANQSVTIAVNNNLSPSSVNGGGVAFNPVGGGTTTISATANGYNNGYAGAQQTVTVSQPSMTINDNWFGDNRLGSGQQITYSVNLGAPEHGGVTVNVSSDAPSVAILSNSATSSGSASISLTIPNGQTSAIFYVQGISGATGDATLSASTSSSMFSNASRVATVVQPILQVRGLGSSTTSLSANDAFNVRAGYLHSNGSSFRYANISAAAGPLTVNLSSSDASVGLLNKTSGDNANQSVTIAVNNNLSPSSVNGGGVAFNPVGGGTTTISATANGHNNSYVGAQQMVTVSQPTMTINDNWFGDNRLGSGQQITYSVNLGASEHGGITVNLSSDNPSVAILSDSATSSGSASVSLTIPNGQTSATFYVQGVSGATGDVTLSATTPLFTSTSRVATVVQPILQVRGLGSSTTSLSANDAFNVRAGYLHSNGSSFRYANISAAAGPLTVNLNSSDNSVGVLNKTSGDNDNQSVTIAVNNNLSPSSVNGGGVAFNPVGGGTTTISATANGYNNGYAGAQQTVTVSQPSMTINDSWWGDNRLGSGQQIPYSVNLGAPEHGGVTVNVSSDNPSVAILSNSNTSSGSASVSLTIPNGQTSATFYVQGVSGATGDVTLSATTALFTSTSRVATVVQPILQVRGLGSSTTSLSANDAFNVRAGYLHSNGSSFRYANISAAAGPLTVNLSSSDASVGLLNKTSGDNANQSVTIAVNNIDSPSSVNGGGVAFNPVGGGTTTISVTANDHNNSYAGAQQTVTVSQPTMSIADNVNFDNYLGGGLQEQHRVTLAASDHGGVTVRIASNQPNVALVSETATTPGAAFIDLFIADGQTNAIFYVQAINGITGTSVLTASTPLFVEQTFTLNVVQSVITFSSLSNNYSAAANDDNFNVRVGYLNGSTSFRAAPASAQGDIQVLLSSSNGSVGQLKSAATQGKEVVVTVPVNQSISPSGTANGGVVFDPLSGGTTIISGQVNGFNNSYVNAQQSVVVNE